MEELFLFFRIILYILGIVSLSALIVLILKLISTVDKTNEILDDVDSKIKTLDGLFSAINATKLAISTLGDKIVEKAFNLVGKIGKNNKKKKKEEDDLYE